MKQRGQGQILKGSTITSIWIVVSKRWGSVLRVDVVIMRSDATGVWEQGRNRDAEQK